jgi:hypothetical protein
MYVVQYCEILCLILNIIWLTCFWIYSTKENLKLKLINSTINPLVMNYKYKSFILNHLHSKNEILSIDSNKYYNITNSDRDYDTKFNIFIMKNIINLLKISKIRGKREKNSGSM